MEIYKNRQRLGFYFELFFLKLSFDFIYWYIIQKTYSKIMLLNRAYNRNVFGFDFDGLKYFASWILTILIIFALNKFVINKDEPHELIIVGLIIISFFPNMTLFALSNLEWEFFIWQAVYWLWSIGSIQLLEVCFRKYPIKKPEIVLDKNQSKILFWFVVCIFTIGTVIVSYRYFGGFNFKPTIAGDDIYNSRLAARGAFSTLTNFFRNNTMYIVLPLACTIFLKQKKFYLFFLFMAALVLAFNIDSQKAVLFLMLVSIVVAIVVKKNICKNITRGMCFVNIIAILSYYFTDTMLVVEHLFKRLYFLPAIIGLCQFRYVNMNQHMIPMSSLFIKLNLIHDYEYSKLGLPFVVGEEYFGNKYISANTGSFAGAYVYGILGVLIVPLLYALLFKALDVLAKDINICFYISGIVAMIFFIEGATITTVLTVYGYFLLLLLLYLMRCSGAFTQPTPAYNYKIKVRR